MRTTPTISSQPIVLSSSFQASVYGLLTLAMAVTFLGVFVGMSWAGTLLSSGMHFAFAIAELVLIFSARWWVEKKPWNVILFVLFPLLSGITLTPYLLMILVSFTNGASILFNAVLATVFMSLAAALLACIAPSLARMGRMLLLALVGMLVLSLLQIFVPALRTQGVELLIAGAGILLFAAFTAFDLQRVASTRRGQMSPFLLALSLYLDIFNLFLMILRFMTALSGDRR